MSPMLFFYFADVIPSLGALLTMLGIISLVLGSIFLIGILNGLSEQEEIFAAKVSKYSISCALIFVFLAVLTPSRETLYLMGASEVVTQIVTNEKVSQLAGNSIKLIEKRIQEELDKQELLEKGM